MESHESEEIGQAFTAYSSKMATLEEELSKLKQEDKTFQGYDSADLATAFQTYAKEHQGEGLPDNFVLLTDATSTDTDKVNLYKTPGTNMTSATTMLVSSTAYSWAALLTQMQWARVIYCIVWITTGLLLLFFGYSSVFWLNKLGARGGSRASLRAGLSEATSKRQQQKKRSLLNGGIGGLVIGFLFFSYLASIINNTLCADNGKKTLAPRTFFAIWLVSGLLGSALGGYFFFMAKVMIGVMGGTSLTIIFTAMFGIQSILIRAILVAILCTLLTAPLLASRINSIQKLVINASTSITGSVTFLDGVALFASPYKASSNWIDLWTMLFCSNTSTSRALIMDGWGTSAFKIYIAGSVLGAAIGFIFELLLHRQSGKDADTEWNEYLGTYTQRVETGGYEGKKSGTELATSMGAAARAGLFEPAPSAWQRMVDYFDSDSNKPAHYGNLSAEENGRHHYQTASITEKLRKKKSSSNKKSRKGRPARFQTLNKRDDFDDQESSEEGSTVDEKDIDKEATEFGSEDEDKVETKDLLSSSKRKISSPQKENYRGYSMTRPSTLRSNASHNSSQLSGTTANNSTSQVSLQYCQSDTPSSPTMSSPGQNHNATAVTATPSLINAITRIQVAQQAALAWQKERDDDSTDTLYKSNPS